MEAPRADMSSKLFARQGGSPSFAALCSPIGQFCRGWATQELQAPVSGGKGSFPRRCGPRSGESELGYSENGVNGLAFDKLRGWGRPVRGQQKLLRVTVKIAHSSFYNFRF